MPKIRITSLSTGVIDKALQELKEYQKKIEQFPEKAVKLAVDMGVEQAKEIAMYMNAYDTGELVNGIVGEAKGSKGKIVSTAFHTMFVEFGTGIRGKQDPNQYDYAQGWKYDVNEHGEAGWVYKGDDGKLHWTKGMPSRPFMHDTAEILQQSRAWIAKTVLKGDG